MSMVKFSVKHGRPLAEAEGKLRTVVEEARGKMGRMLTEVTWQADGRAVRLAGTGFKADVRVDAEQVHVEADVALLGMFGGPVVEGLKRLVGERFKSLPPGK